MRTIIVDDEPLLLSYMKELLQEMDGVEVLGTYSNPYQALEVITTELPDVVFLDIEMPELSGVQIAAHIQREHPFIHIVFVTASSEAVASQVCDNQGIDYLWKPVCRDRLSAIIRRLWDGKLKEKVR